MNRVLAVRNGARPVGANLATAWHSQAPWAVRCRALALTLVLAAGGVAPANGQRRAEAPSTATAASGPLDAALTEASTRFSIPRDWIAVVLRAESGGNAQAVSTKGALGLMQLMPATWQQLRMDLHLGSNVFDPHDNILAGAAYLRQMLDRYGTSGFLAAYNAGPGRYDDFLATGKPLPSETRTYIARLEATLHLRQPGDGQISVVDPRLVLFVGAKTDIKSPPTPSQSPMVSGNDRARTFALAPQPQGLFVGTAVAQVTP